MMSRHVLSHILVGRHTGAKEQSTCCTSLGENEQGYLDGCPDVGRRLDVEGAVGAGG